MRIETRGLSRRFGKVAALTDVTLEIPSGGKIGLIGPNGSGKSTMTRILVGLLAYEGRVEMDGLSPRRDRGNLAGRIAYVPQVAPNLAAPVGELVAAIASFRRIAPVEVFRIGAQLDIDIASLAEKPFRRLSGGMKQKILIALALSARADCFIMDEPTASLDAQAREKFFRLFAERCAEKTVILCSHRLEEMRHLVDHVIVLDEGRSSYAGDADRYLAAHALSTIQVRVARDDAASWIRELGFARGAGDWWYRTVDQTEKNRLLPQLAEHLGDRVDNLHIRDLESISIDPENGAS
ncbi:MAG: ABC transporter ATP-binding protein [Deltaproteobacteria bacterium]|nr:ABC transporter ATP-binding protein [Deltaproteobacteria bacterium]